MKAATSVVLLAALVALAGCHRASEPKTSAPGTGGADPATVISAPAAPDGGSAGAPPVAVGTASVTTTAPARKTGQPGSGLNGGLGGSGLGMTGSFPETTTSTRAAGAGAATDTSPNRTARSNGGNR